MRCTPSTVPPPPGRRVTLLRAIPSTACAWCCPSPPASITSTPPCRDGACFPQPVAGSRRWSGRKRSEEHTSELQSRLHLVCRLLLEKKKKKKAEFRE